jgi:hypothetical protein
MIPLKAFLLLSVVWLACMFVAGCGNRRDLFYPALADADKAGELNRGWLPDYLPKTSRAIHLVEQDYQKGCCTAPEVSE